MRAATLDLAGIKLEQPGSQNWTAIHNALGLPSALAADPLASDPLSLGPGYHAAPLVTPHVSPGEDESPLKHGKQTAASKTPLQAGPGIRRWAHPWPWIAVAAAGLVLGTALGWTAAGVLGPTSAPSPSSTQTASSDVVLAQTALTPLAAHTGSGEAQVRELPDGTRQLMIRLSNDRINGFRGVWVGSADLTRMVSLGVLDADSGSFTIPDGVSLDQYPVVDISNQPYNGDPAHSDDSIARGTLNPGH
ncbi:anti-sigma factor [Pseudarthrobacter sulfonivorans]|uniref:anti-sigma factor n=1 Tax=Pseudarthrobacter sulfonivorans TaxID=121292 RepID=UPI0021022AFF|nr:anti-sigma factor [Pseudarthrobacter sulfonivorans]